ncbi:MAG TPA: amidase family protein [Vicinamibacterales bacterium]|nr:amidase family protein [Vicinamibacterales bacterium]
MTLPRSTRRTFLQTAGAVLVASAAPNAQRAPAGGYDAFEKSIRELQADMASGATTAVGLVRFYLRRIAAFDQAGPRLNAVLALNPRAEAVAAALDAERRRGRTRGLLHGIPVLIKDNLDTTDMPTTGGCLALSGRVPREDAFQVRRLREAGAVILGKVNLHELALGLTTVSSLGGQTLNPYDLSRAPGGSSGGSGAAAAANFAAFTVGTDTSGSIRIPASHNAIVGLRPSAGLSSRSGVIPFGHTQDSVGPMARTVADVAAVLDATVGHDPADPVTAESSGKTPASYLSSLREDALRGARLGVLAELFGAAPEDQPVAAVVRRAVADMTARGAIAVEVMVPNLGARLMASNLLTQELKFDLRDYLRRPPAAAVTSLDALLVSGLHTAQFQAFIEGANALPDDYPAGDDYRLRLAAREALRRAVVEVMDANRLDALVYPTTRRIAPLVGGNQLGSNAALSAQSGCPAITVPAGVVEGGFPVGVELLSRPFSEPVLLALAFAYEQATKRRRPPASAPRGVGHQVRRVPAVTPPATSRVVRIDVEATSAQAVPASTADFRVVARLQVEEQTRRLSYTLSPAGPGRAGIAGVYLHRRAQRPNGGVAHILTKRLEGRMTGTVTLLETELADLKAGRCYLAAVSRQSPLVGVRADLEWPAG